MKEDYSEICKYLSEAIEWLQTDEEGLKIPIITRLESARAGIEIALDRLNEKLEEI